MQISVKQTLSGLLCLAALIASAAADPLESVDYADWRVGDVLAQPAGEPDPTKPAVEMVVTQFAHPNEQYPLISRTIQALQKTLGKNNLTVRMYSGEVADIQNAHLVLSSAGTFARMTGKGARDLATVVTDAMPNPNQAEGSLFVTLGSRSDIREFADMEGKRVSATGPNAFAGYHIALGEISKRGYNPDNFFSEFVASGHDMLQELVLLRKGLVDVVVLRTCIFEEMEKAGMRIDDLKPIGIKESAHPAGCRTSTDLYPNWTLFATTRLDADSAKNVVLTLLSMPSQRDGLRWGIASDFSAADRLYRTIRRGPYEYLRTWTWSVFWDEYKVWIVSVVLCIIALIAHAWRTGHLVTVRTAQLREALVREVETKRRAQVAQDRMQTLQRAGAVGQMSSIIAHELRQPLSSIISYSQGLSRLLDDSKVNSDMVGMGVDRIRLQAQRAEEIVEKVRAYAKGNAERRETVRLNALIQSVIETVNDAKLFPVVVTSAVHEDVSVHADLLELELCLQNLIKNAMQAARASAQPSVEVSLERIAENGREMAKLSVRDNGPELSKDAYARLSQVLHSKKLDGLGLGLAIVRLIVENHGGRLEFSRASPTGLNAVIILPANDSADGDEELKNA